MCANKLVINMRLALGSTLKLRRVMTGVAEVSIDALGLTVLLGVIIDFEEDPQYNLLNTMRLTYPNQELD